VRVLTPESGDVASTSSSGWRRSATSLDQMSPVPPMLRRSRATSRILSEGVILRDGRQEVLEQINGTLKNRKIPRFSQNSPAGVGALRAESSA